MADGKNGVRVKKLRSRLSSRINYNLTDNTILGLARNGGYAGIMTTANKTEGQAHLPY